MRVITDSRIPEGYVITQGRSRTSYRHRTATAEYAVQPPVPAGQAYAPGYTGGDLERAIRWAIQHACENSHA